MKRNFSNNRQKLFDKSLKKIKKWKNQVSFFFVNVFKSQIPLLNWFAIINIFCGRFFSFFFDNRSNHLFLIPPLLPALFLLFFSNKILSSFVWGFLFFATNQSLFYIYFKIYLFLLQIIIIQSSIFNIKFSCILEMMQLLDLVCPHPKIVWKWKIMYFKKLKQKKNIWHL